MKPSVTFVPGLEALEPLAKALIQEVYVHLGRRVRSSHPDVQPLRKTIYEEARRALSLCGGKKRRAAAVLGIGRDRLYAILSRGPEAPQTLASAEKRSEPVASTI